MELKCIEAKWNKVESGTCFVQYDVKLKTESGQNVYNRSGYNMEGTKVCNLKDFAHVSEIQLTVRFKTANKSVTARVSQSPLGSLSSRIYGRNISYLNLILFLLKKYVLYCCRNNTQHKSMLIYKLMKIA